jgi:hypothetical protein
MTPAHVRGRRFIHELPGDFPSLGSDELSECDKLRFWILVSIRRADPRVDPHAHRDHPRPVTQGKTRPPWRACRDVAEGAITGFTRGSGAWQEAITGDRVVTIAIAGSLIYIPWAIEMPA